MSKKKDLDIFFIKELFSQGLKRNQVAKILGISYQTLYRFLKQNDLKTIPNAYENKQHNKRDKQYSNASVSSNVVNEVNINLNNKGISNEHLNQDSSNNQGKFNGNKKSLNPFISDEDLNSFAIAQGVE